MNDRTVNRSWKWAAVILAAMLLATLACACGAGFGGLVGYSLGKHRAPDTDALPRTVPPVPEYPLPGPSDGKPWLGVAYQMQEQGALVVEVVPGSPADEAGLRPGDLITEVEGEAVTPDRPLARLILQYAPGSHITLTIERNGERREVAVTLGDAASQPRIPPGEYPGHCPGHHDG